MKKTAGIIFTLLGLILLAGALALGFLRFRMDLHDYSKAVAFTAEKAQEGRAVKRQIEALEEPFAHDETLQYRLGYDGDDIVVIAISSEDLQTLSAQPHIISRDQLLMIFEDRQELLGCSRPLDERIRKIIRDEYRLTDSQLEEKLGTAYLAVNQPVNQAQADRYLMMAAAALAASLLSLLIALIVRGKKEKKKNREEVCERTVYLVE